jgi:hypothetical protein
MGSPVNAYRHPVVSTWRAALLAAQWNPNGSYSFLPGFEHDTGFILPLFSNGKWIFTSIAAYPSPNGTTVSLASQEYIDLKSTAQFSFRKRLVV